MLDDHLRRQQIDLVAEVAVVGIVDPEHAAHTHVLEVAQTEVGDPEVGFEKWREGDAVVLEHVEESLFGRLLVEFAVGIEVGIGVLFGVQMFLVHKFMRFFPLRPRPCAACPKLGSVNLHRLRTPMRGARRLRISKINCYFRYLQPLRGRIFRPCGEAAAAHRVTVMNFNLLRFATDRRRIRMPRPIGTKRRYVAFFPYICISYRAYDRFEEPYKTIKQ